MSVPNLIARFDAANNPRKEKKRNSCLPSNSCDDERRCLNSQFAQMQFYESPAPFIIDKFLPGKVHSFDEIVLMVLRRPLDRIAVLIIGFIVNGFALEYFWRAECFDWQFANRIAIVLDIRYEIDLHHVCLASRFLSFCDVSNKSNTPESVGWHFGCACEVEYPSFRIELSHA